MRKLTVLLSSGLNVISLRDPFIINSYVLVKKAFVFWAYQNILNDAFFNVYEIDTNKNTKFTLHKGYYTFSHLKEILEKAHSSISIILDKANLLVTVTISDKITLDLDDILLNMLGFSKLQFHQGATTSDGMVNMNLHLGYIKIHCNIIDTSMNINERGEKSDVLINLPITTKQSLFGSMQSFTDIETRLEINKGVLNQLEFRVTDQDNRLLDEFGKILLEIYTE